MNDDENIWWERKIQVDSQKEHGDDDGRWKSNGCVKIVRIKILTMSNVAFKVQSHFA